MEYFISWWTTPQLVKYLNDWNPTQGSFSEQKYGNVDITKFRNIFSTAYFIGTVPLFSVLVLISDIRFVLDFPIYVVLHQLYCLISTGAYVLDDIKVVLLLKCVEGCFSEVRIIQTVLKIRHLCNRQTHVKLSQIYHILQTSQILSHQQNFCEIWKDFENFLWTRIAFWVTSLPRW